jgi:hypothetical protein
MSALSQIQESITRLTGDEKKVLALWLNSQVQPSFAPEDERELLATLDDAVAEIDAGRGVPLNEVRGRIGSWATK